MVPTDSPEGLLANARLLVGALVLVADRSWPHGVSTVVEVETADGTALIVKQPRAVDKFDAELHTYRHWAPALEGHVPDLVAADRDTRVLVFSKKPGEIGDGSVSTFREAGRLLRLLNGAEPPTSMVGFAAACRVRFDTWVRRARPVLLDAAEVEFVVEQVSRLADFPDPAGVPCHRDWQPRNWLTALDGSVAVIDFGNARVGHWLQDFKRMWWTEWCTAPELGTRFSRVTAAPCPMTSARSCAPHRSCGCSPRLSGQTRSTTRSFAITQEVSCTRQWRAVPIRSEPRDARPVPVRRRFFGWVVRWCGWFRRGGGG